MHLALTGQVGAGLLERDGFRERICIIVVVCISGGIGQVVCLCNRQCPAADRKGLAANHNTLGQSVGKPGFYVI